MPSKQSQRHYSNFHVGTAVGVAIGIAIGIAIKLQSQGIIHTDTVSAMAMPMIHKHSIAVGQSHTAHSLDYVLAWPRHRQCIVNVSHTLAWE